MGFEDEVLFGNDDDWQVTFEATPDPAEVTIPQAGSATADYTITSVGCAQV